MSHQVRDRYDAMAEEYAALFLDDLERVAADRKPLEAFVALARASSGPVADLGCGPGSLVNFLAEQGLDAIGYDLSAGQVAQARHAFPDAEFHVGDMTALGLADRSLGGIASRYSIIHLRPTQLADVFNEWFRLLAPGAPLFVSFFASRTPGAHGTAFDHTVVTAYELDAQTITSELEDAGFVDLSVRVSAPPNAKRPLDHATIVARKSNG